jgi:hypothetical protein
MSERPIVQQVPQVDCDKASGKLGEIYQDIQDTARVASLAFGIRVMSQCEHFAPENMGRAQGPHLKWIGAEKRHRSHRGGVGNRNSFNERSQRECSMSSLSEAAQPAQFLRRD